jgi:hypothetical protein
MNAADPPTQASREQPGVISGKHQVRQHPLDRRVLLAPCGIHEPAATSARGSKAGRLLLCVGDRLKQKPRARGR